MPTPLSIAHLLLTRRFAGSERYAVELANAQAEAGHHVTMILRAAGAQDRPDAIAHRVSSAVRIATVSNFFPSWHARRLLKTLQPDIAHAHLSGGCRALHGLHTRSKRLATLHIHYKEQQHRHLDGLIAIAPWQLATIPEALRQHCVQIDNWTLPKAANPQARDRLRQSLGLQPDDIVFGTLGRIEPSKGLDVLIDAWKQAKLPANARLVLVGQGSAWAALRQRAPDTVLMPGFADSPRDWLEAFDIFISPARSEPFGLVLLEAMNSGLPILASASQGAQHLHAMINRPLLPVGDVDAFARALHADYTAMPPRRHYAMERFRISDKAQAIEAFYRQLLQQR